jgi:hypothetical protein
MVGINSLVGKTLSKIERKYGKNNEDELYFTTVDNEVFKMYHDQSCCESVNLEDIVGDFDDLLHSRIAYAEEVSNQSNGPKNDNHESYTWTFYKISTIRGSITLRWYGQSNGYYSERVNFTQISG